jgi:regulator of sigma E protease
MTVILGILGISLLIFVHELGHFMAAKWAGARVQTFSLGFDPTIRGVRLKIVSWTWGETEYVIGLIPFGGYVRPADSESGQEGGAEASAGEFASQPPFKRAVIFAAGAAMNIIFGLAAFVLAFAVGVSFQAPEVGSVQSGSPAWDAGLRSGDTLVAVDGKSVESFVDVAVSAVLGGTSERMLTIERDGERRDVAVTPRLDPVMGIPALGINPPISRTIASVEPGSGAAEAGITAGERVLSAVFRPAGVALALRRTLPDTLFVSHLALLASQNPDAPFRLALESEDGAVHEVSLTALPQPQSELPRLGVKARTLRCTRFP